MKERSRTPTIKKIARDRVAVLFTQARKAFFTHPERSHRYVVMARHIAMRQRIRIGRGFRQQFCRHCSSFLVPGSNSRVRVHGGYVVVTCLCCGNRRRYKVVRSFSHGQ